MGAILASLEQRRYLASQGTNLDFWTSLRMPIQRNLRTIGFAVGVAGITSAVVFINDKVVFPGYWTLLPIVATVILIGCGQSALGDSSMLDNRLLVGLGTISFPLYLWHWPLLVFSKLLYGERLTNVIVVLVCAASIVLSVLTYQYIERPIRWGKTDCVRICRWLVLSMLGVLLLGLAAVCGSVPPRIWSAKAVQDLESATKDWDYGYGNNPKVGSHFRIDIEGGRGGDKKKVLFIGDSHMQQYYPRLKLLSDVDGKNLRQFAFVTACGCPMLPGVNQTERGYICDQFYKFAISEATKGDVGTVVIACFWERYFLGGFQDDSGIATIYSTATQGKEPLLMNTDSCTQTFEKLGNDISRLVGLGKKVFVVLSAPSSGKWDPIVQARRLRWASRSSTLQPSDTRIARVDFEKFVTPVNTLLERIVQQNGGNIIDPLDFFDSGGYFYGVSTKGSCVYMDSNHLRASYTRSSIHFLDFLVQE